MVNRSLVNPRRPTNINTPTAVHGSGCSSRTRFWLFSNLRVDQRLGAHGRDAEDLIELGIGIKPGTPGQGVGRGPTSVGQSAVRATPEPATAPSRGRRAGRQCCGPGQRSRSSRGGHVPPGRTGKPCTGRRASGLDVPEDSKTGGSWPHHEGNPIGSTL